MRGARKRWACAGAQAFAGGVAHVRTCARVQEQFRQHTCARATWTPARRPPASQSAGETVRGRIISIGSRPNDIHWSNHLTSGQKVVNWIAADLYPLAQSSDQWSKKMVVKRFAAIGSRSALRAGRRGTRTARLLDPDNLTAVKNGSSCGRTGVGDSETAADQTLVQKGSKRG